MITDTLRKIFPKVYADDESPWGAVALAIKGDKAMLAVEGSKDRPISVELERTTSTDGQEVWIGEFEGQRFVVVEDQGDAVAVLEGVGEIRLPRVANWKLWAAGAGAVAALAAILAWLRG